MEYRQNNAGRLSRSPRIKILGKMWRQNGRVSEVRFESCNESAIKGWSSSELEETVVSLTHELLMTKTRL